MTRFAHDLKSSAAALGLMRLSDLCRNMELACKAGDLDEARSLSDSLKSVLDEALGSLGLVAT